MKHVLADRSSQQQWRDGQTRWRAAPRRPGHCAGQRRPLALASQRASLVPTRAMGLDLLPAAPLRKSLVLFPTHHVRATCHPCCTPARRSRRAWRPWRVQASGYGRARAQRDLEWRPAKAVGASTGGAAKPQQTQRAVKKRRDTLRSALYVNGVWERAKIPAHGAAPCTGRGGSREWGAGRARLRVAPKWGAAAAKRGAKAAGRRGKTGACAAA
jgi:hypothetical protein